MALFGGSEGGLLDVIRCDEQEYLIWKWRPSGNAGSTRKENAIRWGSSLRVKDGEVAVFVYKQPDGPLQDYIEGPFDATIKTANFPVISNIIGLAYAGKAPFQAEVYFINLAGNVKIPFGVPYFDVADPRFLDYPVRLAARGSILFNITDYKGFIRRHRLINFDIEEFKRLIREALTKYIKGIVTNIPADNGIPVLQIERKILEVNDLIEPRIRKAFTEDYGVNLIRFDLDTLEIDKETDEYRELREVTAHLETRTRQAQTDANIQNLSDMQRINAENLEKSLEIQRFGTRLQAESQHLAAHQIDLQAGVLTAAAENLGQMGSMNLGSGASGGGGFNPVGVMTGMAVGGAMGGQMAGMMNVAGQAMQQPMSTPPPPPQILYHVVLNGQGAGPFAWPQLQELVRTGQLNPTVNVWKQGMTAWSAAGSVAELAPLFAAAPPPVPPAGPPPVPGT